MRILTFRRLVGLAAIGGAVYVHKQRNGTWTMASMRDTLQYLLSQAADKLGKMNQAAENMRRPGERSASTGPGSTMNPNGPRTRLPDDIRTRSVADLNKRDDDNRH